MVPDAHAQVRARIDAEGLVEGGVAHDGQPRRGGEALQDDVVLQVETDVRAGEALRVVAACAGDGFGLLQRLSQRSAEDALPAQFGAEGGLAQLPVEPAAQVRPQHIRAVIVERDGGLAPPEQLETVLGVVPIEFRLEMHPSLRLRLHGGVGLASVFELVVVAGAVEGVGAVVPVAESEVPADIHAGACVPALIESLEVPEVGVQLPGCVAAVTVGTAVGSGNLVIPAPRGQVGPDPAVQGLERAALQVQVDAGSRFRAGDDVDGADQRGGAVNASGRPLEDLDTVDLGQVHGQVQGQVARLRVADVDAVEQDGDLVESAAADADVGLHAHRAALAHVHPYGVFEQVIDALDRGRADQQGVQHRHHPGGLVQAQRDARPADGDLVQDFLRLQGCACQQKGQADEHLFHSSVGKLRILFFQEFPAFFLCTGHLGEEFGARVQGRHADAGGHPAGIHVALPVSAGDDPAFAVHPAPGLDGVGRGGIDFREEQRRRPAAHRVARRVTPLASQFVILPREGRLAEALEGAFAVVVGLGLHAHLVGGGQAVNHKPPDLRGVLRRDDQAEGLVELGEQGRIAPHGVPLGDFGALRVEALLLAPHVAQDVIGELGAHGVGRRRQALDQVRQLLRLEIRMRGIMRDVPVAGAQGHVRLDGFAVEPGLAAVDVAHVDEVLVGLVLRTVVARDHQRVVRRRECDGDGVVQHGGRGVRGPVDGVDGEFRVGDDGIDVFHVLDRVVADGYARVASALCRPDARAFREVFGRHLVSHHVGGRQLGVGLVVHVLEQFHDGQAALAEARDDERPAAVALLQEGVESRAHVTHGEARPLANDVLVPRQERVYRRMAIERRPEAVPGGHVGRHAADFNPHSLAVHGVPHVRVMAHAAPAVRPVLLPGRYHIKNVRPGPLRVLIRGVPHRRVRIIRRLRDDGRRTLAGGEDEQGHNGNQ